MDSRPAQASPGSPLSIESARFVDEPVLGFETSGRLAGVAIVAGGRVLCESSLDAETTREEWLLILVHDALRRAGLRPRDLSRVGVSLGPGSFTGLRVGLAAARALAFGIERPLVGVSTHEAMAYAHRSSGRGIVLLTNRRRGTVCLEAGAWEGDAWTAVVPAGCIPESELAERLETAILSVPLPLLFLGEAVESMLAIHPKLAGCGSALSDPLDRVRRPLAVALLASRRNCRLWRGAEMDAVEPLYLRAADAKKPVRPA